MKGKGRVVVFFAVGQPSELPEYDVPDPDPGSSLLRITQAGIGGSESHPLMRHPD